MQKRCQKHVGIDLEVQVAKTQKLTPLTAFFVFFEVKLCRIPGRNPNSLELFIAKHDHLRVERPGTRHGPSFTNSIRAKQIARAFVRERIV